MTEVPLQLKSTSFTNLSLQYSGIHSFSALVATFQRSSYVFSESSREQQLLLMFTNRAIATPITFRVSECKVARHCNYQCMMFWEIWGKRTFCSFGFISFRWYQVVVVQGNCRSRYLYECCMMHADDLMVQLQHIVNPYSPNVLFFSTCT